jgi:threonine dehydrogenase-like Zn-dependent dehydrogenase
MALVVSGYETWMYSREAQGRERSRLAAAIGAHYVSAADVDVPELATDIGNVDLVYEATGAAPLSFEMMTHIGRNAVFVFTGVPGRKAPIEIDADTVMRRLVLNNQVVLGTVNAAPQDFAAALDHLATFRARWPDAVAGLIAARHALEDFRDPLLEKLPGVKHVVRIQEAS